MKAALVVVAVLLAAACGGGSEEPQLVSGYVIERNGVPRLCEAILESFPPQCGEPSLRLVGVVVAGPEERVTLLGTVDGDVFRVSAR